ncbi:alpha/beta-hydrolase [Dacryopinax primogenitus]|uniref:Alpha/beta-hydrolase n=1 Tax=Dacryopinax primogenitus (strain DJM 731) TaxID=1858805 RepID=M5GB56_DACPD|nr:alpha/beta-hydrolase [Dacryopinax primogenitus]EJU03247.1 alpha/beta-hydrolase [Dacryopinax primogenitus]
MAAAITCPNGIQHKRGGTRFSHCESWAQSPYTILLPTDPLGPGYDVCWVDLPERALGDVQTTAEYVAYSIKTLAPQSTTGKVAILAHSQGAGLNVQWALNFWPSARGVTSLYIALAGDFHGTELGNNDCTPTILQGDGCVISVIQQSVGSHYINAQNFRGGSALVPTSSIYTLYDDFVFPETPGSAVSVLAGASNIMLQSNNICGSGHQANHWDMVVDTAAYGLALDALTHGGLASANRFQSIYCNEYASNHNLNLSQTPITAEQQCLSSLVTGPTATSEPMLKSYVCQQGQSTYCSSS